MAEFSKIQGQIQLMSKDGTSIAVNVEGVKVPEGAKAIGEYFGKQVAAALSGITDQGVDGVKQQVAKLESSLQDKENEIKQLEAEIKTMRKAAVVKRSTPKE